MGMNRDGSADLAAAKDSQAGLQIVHYALLDEKLGVYHFCLKFGKNIKIDYRIFLLEYVLESACMRDSAMQRCLSAFETGANLVPCLLTLVALAGGLALAGADSPSHSLSLSNRSLRGSEFTEFHYLPPGKARS